MIAYEAMQPLDPVGNISLILQVTILFLLIVGLPFVRVEKSKKNLMRHGYFTVAALILHTILIFVVMVPAFGNGIPELGELSMFNAVNVWSHVILGTLAEILGLVIVGFWFSELPSRMACAKLKKVMLPLFIIWVISLINGSLIHILGML